MRIWDIDAGFLNDQSLLGEHRELHGIFSIILNQKKGYANHPETLRWKGHLNSLGIRHDLLVEEMQLRGFHHKSPALITSGDINWPKGYINPPHDQYSILKTKYVDRKKGRIPLPKNTRELWAFHKYSVMARDPALYKKTGPMVSKDQIPFERLCSLLVSVLRTPPEKKRIQNAVDHIWGYVSQYSCLDHDTSDGGRIFREIQHLAFEQNVSYLIESTALGELNYWYNVSNTIRSNP